MCKCSPQLLDKESFTSILKAAGIEDEVQDSFHTAFERNLPDLHQLFLEFPGISLGEIKQIRKNSKIEG